MSNYLYQSPIAKSNIDLRSPVNYQESIYQPSFNPYQQQQAQPLYYQQQQQQQQQQYQEQPKSQFQFNEVPLKQTSLINPQQTSQNQGQSQVQQKQPPIKTQCVETTVQPLQILDLFEVMAKWNEKIDELQDELQRLKNDQKPVVKEVSVIDHQQLENVTTELGQVFDQIKGLQRSQKSLEQEYQNLKDNNQALNNKIKQLENDLKDKDEVLDKLNQSIELIQNEINDETQQSDESTTYLYTEVNTWKQKFIDLNKENANVNEELMMTQAEIDHLKNRQVITTQMVERTEQRKN